MNSVLEGVLAKVLAKVGKFWIGGEWVAPAEDTKFSNFRPTTGEVLCEVAQGTQADIDRAVKSAQEAVFDNEHWGVNSTGKQRAVILRKLGDIFVRNKQAIATIDSIDHGKPMREACADVDDAINACKHFADLAEKQDEQQASCTV